MSFTPLYVGETHKLLSLTWTDDANVAVDLTSASITVRFKGMGGAATFTGAGTVNITNAAAGKFTYTFNASDVAAAGNYQLQFKANYGGSDNLFSDPLGLDILAAL